MSDIIPVTQSAPTVIDRGMLPVAEVTSRVRRIQEVMASLMKDGTHYGTIPGTPKPTLYQAGAELLCMTFRIATSPRVEDLSTFDSIRYRVTMQATSQFTGEALGEGVGECSSDEEKYRWRRPVCDEEWADTPESQRREKWVRGKNGNYKAKQVRTSPADVGNTILKMGAKRALIAMTRTVLACSDIFAQDLEDLPEEVRESVVADDAHAAPAHAPIQPPQKKAPAAPAPAQTRGGVLTITNVHIATGNNDNGPWKRYDVTFSDGRVAKTFKADVGEAAVRLHEQKAAVETTLGPSKREGEWTLVELSRVVGGDDVQ